MWGLALAVVLGGVFCPTVRALYALPHPLKMETFRCRNPEWLALSSAIDTYCTSHRARCKDRHVLPMCQSQFRGVEITREPGFVLRLNPDCWNWWVTFVPPIPPREARREFWRRPLSELLASKWQIRSVDLDVSHCD